MDRFLKPASRDPGWVQAPGSAAKAGEKRKPGRPTESEEKKRLRREEKEKEKETVVEGEHRATKIKNEKEEDLRKAVSILTDELLQSDSPEKVMKAKEIQELLYKDFKEAGDLRSAEGGKLQGPAGEKGSSSGRLGGGNKVQFKEGKGKSAQVKRAREQEGWITREAHKTIPQKYKFIQRIKARMEAAGIGEAEEASQEFWLEVLKQDYPWLKQIRPLKRLWNQKDQIEKDFKQLSQTTGKYGGNIQGSSQNKCLSKRRGIKRLSDNYRKSALEPLFPGLQDWFKKQRTAGNYVDREDLWTQYNYVAKKAAGGVQ